MRRMSGRKRALVRILAIVVALVVVGVPAAVGIRPFIGPNARPLTGRVFAATPARLERGRYLVTGSAAGCVLCHSPFDMANGELRIPDGMMMAGRNWAPDGAAFATAPNLTPDKDTGAGAWTDDQLARAIREGIGHDGRTLFPIMPYQKFREMSDEDLASIIVFLRSMKPVHHPSRRRRSPFRSIA
jgi:hypothetical protein